MVAKQDVACRDVFSRTFVEQLVHVAALGSGMKRNAMWHVPHLVQNTTILYNEPDRLQIMEAILIQELTPTINNQNTGVRRTLKLT